MNPQQTNNPIDILEDFIKYPTTQISADQTLVVPGTSVFFPSLEMGPRSKLLIPSHFTSCNIIIGKGSFDADTEIVADGDNGQDGIKPKDSWDSTGWWQADGGQPGLKGVAGTSGTPGGPAVQNVKIQIGLTKLIRLNIHANGGNGGKGGNGGMGQIGGNKSGMFGSNGAGGAGGDAGSGSNGGRGGNVLVEVWAADSTLDLDAILQYLSVNASGGSAGKKGGPGSGREAGNNSGPHGGPGREGNDGLAGQDVPTQLIKISKPPLP
ncbi:hypothetical protein [Taibaiella soli]|uniref:Collagen-like protein n=1 Tax=Taibaiella soli TaxID=1649169 RepID=A0A2W2AX54_9BACT|nr:hypothetical protein [Taibaiella soli]PZF72564.1 hypothetical protein DN068_11915 [Taibaiella soli]